MGEAGLVVCGEGEDWVCWGLWEGGCDYAGKC